MMKDFYSKYTLITLAVGGVLLVGLGVLIYQTRAPKKDVTNYSISDQPVLGINHTPDRVFMNSLKDYAAMTYNRQVEIEKILYSYSFNGHNTLYTGAVRKGSLAKSKKPDGAVVATLLVDVTPADKTFSITVIHDKNGDFQSFLVSCAPKDKQIDPSVRCMDEQNRG